MEKLEFLSKSDIYLIVTGIIMGIISRLVTLKVDLRQIPSYPSAYFNNIVLGIIASALGSIAIPAILAKDFAAVTFLSVALQHFRELRISESESLQSLEKTEFTKRGEAYIDGIAKTYESRYYISLLTSLATVLTMKIVNNDYMPVNIMSGAAAGLIILYFSYFFTKGRTISVLCGVSIGEIEVRGSELYVDGMFVTNYLGADISRNLFLKEGIAVVLSPRDEWSRLTLDNLGQRQAIMYEAVKALGVKRFKFMRRNFESGKVVIAFVPIVNDKEKLLKAVRNTPVLENSRKIKRIMKVSFGGQNE